MFRSHKLYNICIVVICITVKCLALKPSGATSKFKKTSSKYVYFANEQFY